MLRTVLAAAMLACLNFTPTLVVAQASSDVVIGQRLSMHSKILKEDRRYMVYLPQSYYTTDAAERRYPVVYLLDGGAHFNATTGIIHHLSSYTSAVRRIPEMIVVALPNTRRTRDLTPTHTTSGPYSEGSGGSEAFLRFISDELIPHIDSKYRTSPERTLAGHSLGGLFALCVFLEQPELFRNYIAIDPSLWWDNQLLVRRIAERPIRKLSTPASIFIAQANSPESEYSDLSLKTQHETGIQRFRTLLEQQQIALLRVRYAFFEDETHLSVPLMAIYRGLLFANEGYAPPSVQASK